VTEVLVVGEEVVGFCPYQPAPQRLLDIRILIGFMCRGIFFFKERCQAHGVKIVFGDLDCQHRDSLSKQPAFKLLEPFLDKSVRLEEFTDFQECNNVTFHDHYALELNTLASNDSFNDSESGAGPSRRWVEHILGPARGPLQSDGSSATATSC